MKKTFGILIILIFLIQGTGLPIASLLVFSFFPQTQIASSPFCKEAENPDDFSELGDEKGAKEEKRATEGSSGFDWLHYGFTSTNSNLNSRRIRRLTKENSLSSLYSEIHTPPPKV